MTARPLTPGEARRVKTCDGCGHPWRHHKPESGCWGARIGSCPCTRPDETLTQVAALRAEWQAVAWERAIVHACEMLGARNVGWRNPYRETKKDPTEKEN